MHNIIYTNTIICVYIYIYKNKYNIIWLYVSIQSFHLSMYVFVIICLWLFMSVFIIIHLCVLLCAILYLLIGFYRDGISQDAWHFRSQKQRSTSIAPSDQGLFWNVKASDPGLDAKSSR